MSGFENFSQEAAEIEREIIRKGIALGIDWDDEAAVRAIAREALTHTATVIKVSDRPEDIAREQLFGLINLMLRVMTESATQGIETHGGPAWKALARALWAEREPAG